MKEFIKVSDVGLGKTVEEGDYNGLVECMGHLMAVREKAETTDGMFEPLRETIDLLKVGGMKYTTYKQFFLTI